MMLYVVLLALFFLKVVLLSHPTIVVSFLCFGVFYLFTVFFGVLDVATKVFESPDSDVFRMSTVRLVETCPFLLPTLFFAAATLAGSLFFPPIMMERIVYFLFFFLTSLLIYFTEMGLVIAAMRRRSIIRYNLDQQRLKEAQIKFGKEGSGHSRKKLLLINPVNQSIPGYSGSINGRVQPLGLGIIAALTTSEFYVKLIDENVEAFQYEEADLVGISALTSTATRGYEIASEYSKNNVPVVMGGIHASMVPDEALRYVDSVVIGEAESVWQDVTLDFLKGDLKKTYKGVRLPLDNMVLPKRELYSNQYSASSVQTSRGCPLNCDFCSVTTFNGREYRFRPIAEVLDELEGIPNRDIFFVDDNLVGYGKIARQRAKGLFRGMIDRQLNKSWLCQASINFGADEELLLLAKRSGCSAVLLGLESDDRKELMDMKKEVNLRYDYDRTLRTINRHGIGVFGAFIFGVESETKNSMWRKMRFITQKRIDVIQTTVLTPLPGTRFFEEAQKNNRLSYTDFPKDWERYNMTEYTYRIEGIDEEEFLKHFARCLRRIFSKETLSIKLFKTAMHTRHLQLAISAYVTNLSVGRVWAEICSIAEDRLNEYPDTERARGGSLRG
jgi:radical SAM superfamily enzyme YgiQ (UPF0313 family)